jgi:hypothetical protein
VTAVNEQAVVNEYAVQVYEVPSALQKANLIVFAHEGGKNEL